MKKHLNTLFVTTQGAYLSKEGETVVVKAENEVRIRVPVHTLGGIVCFGNVGCSPFLMGFCAENDVAISFLSEHGRFLARVQGPVSGNVLLRREQYRKADDQSASVEVAKSVLTGKLANCRTVLQRALRDHGEKMNGEAVKGVSSRMSYYLERLNEETNLDALRGIEGDAAHMYFGVFNELITTQKEDFFFEERNRRPPLARVYRLLPLKRVNFLPSTGVTFRFLVISPDFAGSRESGFYPSFCMTYQYTCLLRFFKSRIRPPVKISWAYENRY